MICSKLLKAAQSCSRLLKAAQMRAKELWREAKPVESGDIASAGCCCGALPSPLRKYHSPAKFF
jgi:hypothetical protein